jgi:PLP dependent protein
MRGKEDRLRGVQARIREACLKAGRSEREVRLLAVSKTKGWEEVRDFLELGLTDFGENYVQEALTKMEALSSSGETRKANWHLIGHLQSKKAKLIPGKFALFHALDSFSLAEKLSRRASELGLVQDCLVQVNVDGEETKAGVGPTDLLPLLERLSPLTGIRVLGLMCIPAPGGGRRPFARLREILEKANAAGAYREKLTELSMGMSADFPEAVLEGATIVRVGASLFGERI